MGDSQYLAVIARDPVPEHLLTPDQVQAHRRAELYLDVLNATDEIVKVDDPLVFIRQFNNDISTKQVPGVKELVHKAHERADATFYGFINADIILAPHFLTELARARFLRVDIVILHRTDVANLSEVDAIVKSPDASQAEVGKKVSQANSADGIFLSEQAYQAFMEYYPDFVIAEPWWDTAFIHWANQSPYHVCHMAENQAIHVKHPQGWSFRTKAARRAYDLYAKLLTTWPIS